MPEQHVGSQEAVAEDRRPDGAPTDLRSYARDEWSQHGEDGILARIFELFQVAPGTGWCVEFGAWDGLHASNTYRLIRHESWRAVLIEADEQKFSELENNMSGFPDVVCLNVLVDFEPPNDLDSLFATTPLPRDFDLLSIDIDGNDYHIWEGLSSYSPKVVVIELNPTIPNHVEFVQRRDPKVHQGNSLLSLTRLATEKGYELAAVTKTNAIFARKDYFPLLGIADNSLDALSPNKQYQTHLFQLFDGTLVLDGYKRMFWHEIELRPEKLQVIPRRFREFPGYFPGRTSLRWAVWRRAFYGVPIPFAPWLQNLKQRLLNLSPRSRGGR